MRRHHSIAIQSPSHHVTWHSELPLDATRFVCMWISLCLAQWWRLQNRKKMMWHVASSKGDQMYRCNFRNKFNLRFCRLSIWELIYVSKNCHSLCKLTCQILSTYELKFFSRIFSIFNWNIQFEKKITAHSSYMRFYNF